MVRFSSVAIVALLATVGIAETKKATLKDHREALGFEDVEFKPYKHRRINRRNGIRDVVYRGYRTNFFDDRNFHNPRIQNPHNAVMFKPPGGGLTKIRGLVVQKWYYIPGRIARYGRNTPINGYSEHYVYPIGTRFAETLSHSGKVFEVRCVHKVKAKQWDFDIQTTDKTPPGYEVVANCADCHKHAGKDSHHGLPTVGRQRWWGYGTAPGDDFNISFDPRQEKGLRYTR